MKLGIVAIMAAGEPTSKGLGARSMVKVCDCYRDCCSASGMGRFISDWS